MGKGKLTAEGYLVEEDKVSDNVGASGEHKALLRKVGTENVGLKKELTKAAEREQGLIKQLDELREELKVCQEQMEQLQDKTTKKG